MIDPELVKQESHKELQLLGVQVAESLPTLEPESELSPRSPAEVATRAVVLGYLLRFAFGQPASDTLASLEKFKLSDQMTESELHLLESSAPAKQEIVNTTWQIEGVECLAWCLGLSELDPTGECPESLASLFPKPDKSPANFIANAALRPFEQLYQQADLHYRMHWATREARLNSKSCLLNESIISERRRAIDWVIGVAPNWDDIPMST